MATPVERSASLDIAFARERMPSWSIGLANATRVVVAPALYDQLGEIALRAALIDLRQHNELIADLVAESKQHATDLVTSCGVDPPVDCAGRIVVRR